MNYLSHFYPKKKRKITYSVCVTFLTAASLQVCLAAVLTAVAGSPLFLKQLVNTLDDALQRLIYIQPNLLLKGERHKAMCSICPEPCKTG